MAFVREKYCYKCKKETHHVNGDCDECKARERNEKLNKAVLEWDAARAAFKSKTQEDRIQYLYDILHPKPQAIDFHEGRFNPLVEF